MSILITKNFSVDEVRCKCGCGKFEMSHEFMTRLQVLRDVYGKAMKITSGYRCPEWNAKISGAEDSYHMRGRAVDILCGSGRERHKLISLAMQHGFGGIGVGKDFIHLDDREIGTLWAY